MTIADNAIAYRLEPSTDRTTPRVRRRQDIELLRIVGAFGIVWFHSRVAGWEFAYSGLMFFLIISTFLWSVSGSAERSVLQRARRLLVPWLFWLAFYGVVNLATAKPFVPLDKGIVLGVLAGSSIHLWFLPFIFGVLVLLDRIRGRLRPEVLGYGCAVAAIAVFVSSPLWTPWTKEMGAPIAQYSQALFGVLVGVFLGHYRLLGATWRKLLLAVIVLMTVCFYIVSGAGIPYIVGTTVAAYVLLRGIRFPEGLELGWLSAATLGIYLIHPFYLRIVGKFSAIGGIWYPILAFLLSALTIVLLRHFSPRIARYVA
ncbi:MAG TPA: acyltransferase family protein [Burkholderiales bacterium]|nr:acyltransferase family protein [Burkholderiales bacterium]